MFIGGDHKSHRSHLKITLSEATHFVILKQSPKYDASPSNSVGDIKQNH